jgi:hypothetical protein
MYSGGLFIRDGTAELTDDLLWQEYPVGPSGGALLWEAELSELGASLTFTATGPQ